MIRTYDAKLKEFYFGFCREAGCNHFAKARIHFVHNYGNYIWDVCDKHLKEVREMDGDILILMEERK